MTNRNLLKLQPTPSTTIVWSGLMLAMHTICFLVCHVREMHQKIQGIASLRYISEPPHDQKRNKLCQNQHGL